MIPRNHDYHIHTNYSPDADQEATFEAYINQAQALGLTKLTFTDHVDIDAVHPLFHTPIDYNAYLKEFNTVKQTSPIDIQLGVEIGYQSHVVEEINTFLSKYPFTHVILSIHYLEQKDLYTQEYFIGKTKRQAYQTYFETCLDAIESIDQFDVFGHLDYITRYSPYGDYDYEEYKDIIDRILQALIRKNKGLEINTSGIANEQRTYPKQEVLDRFIELGGTTLVYGSDAHKISELGRFFIQKKQV
ncbi:histidinol-phosphatase HisJ family protein [Candidatus Xianfuyuplasma coldseepsis]|uniref:Histidinol-phosphatase n=1 Tax=Candidatus Xianfuyuplasma coldseepsis TaxID=2782163 RepID=A0A7L7KQ30_9MOLU|nr:histidinol-phosphatase HisJ family protein [Xianfuyuplasma coldseepsis]QMS84787.1 histidinol-phosphatase HisJ family protein [Xianfuyuplasma coldseepsis]